MFYRVVKINAHSLGLWKRVVFSFKEKIRICIHGIPFLHGLSAEFAGVSKKAVGA